MDIVLFVVLRNRRVDFTFSVERGSAQGGSRAGTVLGESSERPVCDGKDA